MSRILGVLGGMGPAATVAFLARVQALTPATADEDHVRVIADINPQVPNRHTQPEAAGRALGQMAQALKTAGAQVLAMPCNTAHAHADAIRAAGLPTRLSDVEHTFAADALIARMAGDKKAEGGRLTLILARAVGDVFTDKNVDAEAVRAFLIGEGAA